MKRIYRTSVSRRSFLAGTGAVAAGLTVMPRMGWSAEEARVNFYNWDTYIGETTLEDFKDASGISVKMDLFADNDELFAKLKSGNPGYDLIVPTNDFVERMIVAKMIQPIDQTKIPNFKNIDPVFQTASFDPGRKYSIPYMWGTMGLGYRKSRVDGVPDSWKHVFDSDEYSGRVALLSESTSLLGMVLKYLGYSMNSKDPKQIKQAEELLIKQKKHIKVFADDNGQDLLLSGEVDIAVEWNGDILQIMEEDEDIGYVVPKEGAMVWQDCLCIPTGAPHPGNAHKLINYILDAEAGAAIADFIQYATPNAAAKKLLPAEYRDNPAIFPSDATLAKCESAIYQGEAVERLFEEAWTRVQAG
jgi:spermidine/putrescine transport system substrate-binding protein